ncbi:copper homeostasis protein [Flavobacteriaceae bacterium MAR_2010_188]|nr:copper homeostasis protein [Flavobacteriaceae bacterium MAR_2010_188]
MKLEICTNSFASAENAEAAGASQIELCSELSIGGITPSYGLLKQVTSKLAIPVNVLIRPRGGNFCYSFEEFEIMKSDILICKELGCHGIVSGILHKDNILDQERTAELIQIAQPMKFIFHRAFDLLPNPKKALFDLIDMKVKAILTSGQSKTAIEGIDFLKEINELASDKITIMPGGGINSKNAKTFRDAGFGIIHSSASEPIENSALGENEVSFFGNYKETISGFEEIKEILKAIN